MGKMEKCIRKFQTQCAMTLTGGSCVPKFYVKMRCLSMFSVLYETGWPSQST